MTPSRQLLGTGRPRGGALTRFAPWIVLVAAVVATTVHVVLVVSGPLDHELFPVARADLAIAPIGLSFAVVGFLLARRVPDNPVGWLLAVFGVLFVIGRASEVYAAQGLLGGETRPGAPVVNWSVAYGWAFGQLALAMALLHFPTGHLPSRRWRPVRWAAIALTPALVVIWLLLWPVRADASLLRDTSAYPPAAAALAGAVELPVILVTMLAAASLVARYRGAGQLGRLQLRWLFVAVGLLVLGFAALMATGTSPNADAPLFAIALLAVGMPAIPVAIGIAVLRYRLYELDRLVSRTVAYAVVSLLVAGVYLGVVVTAQTGLRPLTGSSDLGVALATLVAAAAFRPLLVRVREVVDRRFDRRMHDARAAVERFGERLRDEVDVDAIQTDLHATATSVLRPKSAAVWLVGTAGGGGDIGPSRPPGSLL